MPGQKVSSPRRRGWSVGQALRAFTRDVVPAQAGLVPEPGSRLRPRPGRPRAGGVGPPGLFGSTIEVESSPRRRGWSPGLIRIALSPESRPRAGGVGPTWDEPALVPPWSSPRRRGWSRAVPAAAIPADVVPAQAGLVHHRSTSGTRSLCRPRAGGVGPTARQRLWTKSGSSPRRRGWSAGQPQGSLNVSVVPAQAGLVPRWPGRCTRRPRRPRAGGVGPAAPAGEVLFSQSSPRRRGWSLRPGRRLARGEVVPAQAGLVRAVHGQRPGGQRRPRAGGVGPSPILRRGWKSWSSPRRRGWSGPGDLELLRRCRRPRAGGVGPCWQLPWANQSRSSPRRRGWSPGEPAAERSADVVPAQAGLVPRRTRGRTICRCRPRAGGVGPSHRATGPHHVASSPRRRGWSGERLTWHTSGLVVPAQAGLVPAARARPRGRRCRPRVGGAGSTKTPRLLP